jgi:hypothetical protein
MTTSECDELVETLALLRGKTNRAIARTRVQAVLFGLQAGMSDDRQRSYVREHPSPASRYPGIKSGTVVGGNPDARFAPAAHPVGTSASVTRLGS